MFWVTVCILSAMFTEPVRAAPLVLRATLYLIVLLPVKFAAGSVIHAALLCADQLHEPADAVTETLALPPVLPKFLNSGEIL